MHSRDIGLIRQTPYLQIPELHDYLTDTADWHADPWDVEVEGRSRLTRTLFWLYPQLPEGFLFSATWDPPEIEERDIERDELLAVIESNSLSASTVYRVEPTAG